MDRNNQNAFDPQLFSEGAGAGTPAAGISATGVNAQSPAAQHTGEPGRDVLYGVQNDAPGGQDAAAEAETTKGTDPEAAFEALIRGEYKQQYDRRVRETVQKRLRSAQAELQRYRSLRPSLEILAKRYDVDAGDAAALGRAIETDDENYAAEAQETGLPPAALRRIHRVERENAALREQDARRRIREDAAAWERQAAEALREYPEMDLEAAVGDERFRSLLRAGADVGGAYMALHHREILPDLLRQAAEKAREQTENAIRAGRSRPAENGAAGSGGPTVKRDVTLMSRADRDEIVRRVARGERIRF